MGTWANAGLSTAFWTCASSLRQEAKLCDIILFVKGKKDNMVGHPAHKILLISASKYFKKLLEREDLRNFCHFPHLSEDGVMAVLDIIYGKEISDDVNFGDAIMAARFLQVNTAIEILKTRQQECKLQESKTSKSMIKDSNNMNHESTSWQDNDGDDNLSQSYVHTVSGQRSEKLSQYQISTQIKQEFQPDVDLTEENSGDEFPTDYSDDMADSHVTQQSQFVSEDATMETSQFAFLQNFGRSFNQGTFNLHPASTTVQGPEVHGETGVKGLMAAGQSYKQRNSAGRYTCDICGQVLTGKTALKHHKLKHTGQKPFACDVCGHRFRQLAHLRGHKERIHKAKAVDHECATCGKMFSKAYELKAHACTRDGMSNIESTVSDTKETG